MPVNGSVFNSCSADVDFNWYHEIQRFYSELTVNIYTGTDRSFDKEGDIVLTSYDILRRDTELFEKQALMS